MVFLRLSAKLYYLCPAFNARSDARVAEEARLESVYTSKAYPEFESRSLRQKGRQPSSFFISQQLFYKTKTISTKPSGLGVLKNNWNNLDNYLID